MLLAKDGIRFTQFYNTGRCCPTRACLLTGLYSHQAGVGHMNGDYKQPGYRGFLTDNAVTLGDMAREAGYMSIATGKWHVGAKDESMMPTSHGFDRFYGVPEGGGFYFQVKEGRTIRLNDKVVASVKKPLPDKWYSTDAWTDYSLKFIDEAKEANKPFLLYLAHNAPHFPLQATAEDIAQFKGNYRAGWDKLSQERWQRQTASGLIDKSWGKTPRPEAITAWDKLSEQDKDRFDYMMATYAACVSRMDRSVGTLVDGLKQRGEFDNTLILFMSDNGGCAESGPKGKTVGDPTTPDSNWFCGESWAWMQDTPFRKYKHYNHEGGIATPLIAHWPKGISDPGRFDRTPTHLIDIMATVVDLTQANYPKENEGQAITPYQGVSLTSIFQGKTLERKEPLFWEHEGNAAIRIDDWKLVRIGGKGSWELYDLSNDRTEQRDLAKAQPERAASMQKEWLAWAKRCNVHPDGLPRPKNKAKQ